MTKRDLGFGKRSWPREIVYIKNRHMGCFQTRSSQDVPKEEAMLRVKERTLGIHQHSAAELDTTVKRAAVDGKVNVALFKRLARKLKLGELQALLACLQMISVDGAIEAHKLSILGVLLGSGDTATKSRLLCEHAEFQGDKQLSPEKIEKLLGDIAFVSINVLGKLCGTLTEAYLTQLKSNAPGVVKQAALDILQGKSSSSHLELSYALTHHFPEWLCPGTVRQLCSRPIKQLMTSLGKVSQKSLQSTANVAVALT